MIRICSTPSNVSQNRAIRNANGRRIRALPYTNRGGDSGADVECVDRFLLHWWLEPEVQSAATCGKPDVFNPINPVFAPAITARTNPRREASWSLGRRHEIRHDHVTPCYAKFVRPERHNSRHLRVDRSVDHASSSSSVLASCRTGVSNPSANQP